jgi:hypothetical protein
LENFIKGLKFQNFVKQIRIPISNIGLKTENRKENKIEKKAEAYLAAAQPNRPSKPAHWGLT